MDRALMIITCHRFGEPATEVSKNQRGLSAISQINPSGLRNTLLKEALAAC